LFPTNNKNEKVFFGEEYLNTEIILKGVIIKVINHKANTQQFT
jgi:hypothetical protein